MDADLMLVVGAISLALAIPAIISSWTSGEIPRTGAILVLIGGVLVVLAIKTHGRPYSFAEIPDVFMSVVGRYLK